MHKNYFTSTKIQVIWDGEPGHNVKVRFYFLGKSHQGNLNLRVLNFTKLNIWKFFLEINNTALKGEFLIQ